jgi:peptide/nickel transport system substrate-binding protein
MGNRLTGRLLALIGTLLLVVTACSPPTGTGTDDGQAADTSSPAEGETTAEAEASGGRLVVARTGDIDNLDPHLATAFQTYQALELVYDALFEFDPDLNVVPGLAETFEYSDDGTTLTLTLREDVTFHGGDTLDSADVAATLERILDEGTGAVARANLLSIASVETPDERTVVLSLSEPDSTLPAALADVNTAVVSADDIDAGTLGQEPNGTGAFMFDDWEQGGAFSVSAFQDYWQGAPELEGVDIRVIPDESSVLAGLRADQFHLGVLTDPTVVTQIPEGELTVERTPALAYHALMLNSDRGPLEDVRVRQAIACAIDRQGVVDAALLGEGEVTGPYTIPAFENDPYDGLPCDGPDVELANQLMEEAGQGDGFSLDTIVMTGGYATAEEEAQSLQAQLTEIGVQLDLETLETNVYVDRWLAAEFDAAVALNGGRPDPHLMYARYFTSGGNLNEVAAYSSDELDQLFAEGKAETDPDARAQIYDQISTELLEASPWAWVFNGFEYRVLQPEVQGFVPLPTGSLKSLRQVSLG